MIDHRPNPGAQEPKMELTLRYHGPLVSRGDPFDQQKIRKKIHQQLAAYREMDDRLKSYVWADPKNLQIAALAKSKFDIDRPVLHPRTLFWRYPLCGYDFAPLVSHANELHCHLNIRLYRKLQTGGILFTGGDIDNRLKTFFDALQVPKGREHMPKEDQDNEPPNPKDWPVMFCLLDDDAAITKLTIESIKMLTPIPDEYATNHPENYVEMEIDVLIKPATAIQGSIPLLFA